MTVSLKSSSTMPGKKTDERKYWVVWSVTPPPASGVHSHPGQARVFKSKTQSTNRTSWEFKVFVKVNCLKQVDYIGKLCVKWEERSSSPQLKFLYLNLQGAEAWHLQDRLGKRFHKDSGAEHKSNQIRIKGSWWEGQARRWKERMSPWWWQRGTCADNERQSAKHNEMKRLFERAWEAAPGHSSPTEQAAGQLPRPQGGRWQSSQFTSIICSVFHSQTDFLLWTRQCSVIWYFVVGLLVVCEPAAAAPGAIRDTAFAAHRPVRQVRALWKIHWHADAWGAAPADGAAATGLLLQ